MEKKRKPAKRRVPGRPGEEARTMSVGTRIQTHDIRLPSVKDYVGAFRQIEQRVTPNQRKMLTFHHDAAGRVVSATVLAKLAGYDGYGGANLQYGRLGGQLLGQLNITLPGNYAKCGILVEFVNPQFAANQQWLWVLRTNVAIALEQLGWVSKTLHLLYPDEGLE